VSTRCITLVDVPLSADVERHSLIGLIARDVLQLKATGAHLLYSLFAFRCAWSWASRRRSYIILSYSFVWAHQSFV